MSGGSASRGGTPVGYLSEFPASEVRAISLLRSWCSDGAACAASLAEAELGPGDAGPTVSVVGQIASMLAHHGRRPMIRHACACDCVGGDEACFATLVSAAAEGAREDAMMLACLMVRADMSPALVALAEELGLRLKRGSARPVQARPAGAVLH